MPPYRPARPGLRSAAVVFAIVSLAGAAVAGPAGPAGAASTAVPSPSSPTPAATQVRYAVTRPMCNAPADPGAMRCYGLKRVDVPRGTVGAYRYRTLATAAAPSAAANPVTPAGVGAGPSGGYTPAQLAAAYGYNPRVRSSQTIGIVLWHDAPNVLGDLNRFNARYGLPRETSRSFRKINERGQAAPLPRRDAGSAGEIALDTQAVRAVCATCRILLVEAEGPYDTNLANAVNTAVRLGATIVTNSYGTSERRFSAKVQAAYRHPGVAMFVSTGDSGWYGWDYANDPRYRSDDAASFPATSPDVIAVGGTTLTLDARNRRAGEVVWNSDGASDTRGSRAARPLGASGGGCSRYFAAPAWQRVAPGYAAAGCNGKRLAADVALVADPATGFDVYDSYGSGGWVTVGGTSLSAPLAAGMLALVGGPRGSRFPATALYGNADARPANRFDVTVGGNGFCHTDTTRACADEVYLQSALRTHNPNNLGAGLLDCSFPRTGSDYVPPSSRSECTAKPGFDGPTGVGTPNSPNLFTRTDPYLQIRYSGDIRARRDKGFTAGIVQPIAAKITSLTWQWGDGRTSVIRNATTARHVYARKGQYTITLISGDSRGQAVVVGRTITVR